MEKNNKPILEFFDANPNTSYEIVFVLDIDYSEYPYYYKVLVKDIKIDFYTTILIPPELLRYRYKIGNIYKGNKIIGKNTVVKSATFTIDTSAELQIQNLKEVINESDLNLVNYDYLKHFYLKQNCYSFEFDDFQLIIPCYTIANRFYFLSSSMKKAVFNNSLSSLCEDTNFYKNGNTVFISVRSTAAKRDYPFICRFLENNDSKNNFSYFINQKSSQEKAKPFGQIKANFPTNEKFEIDTSYIVLNNTPKPKILVIDIFNDSSSFNFTKIHVEKYTSKSGKSSIEIDIPVNKKKFKKKKSNKIEKTKVNEKDVRKIVIDILVEELGVQKEYISDNSILVDDLGADSLDLVIIVITLEEKLNIVIKDEVFENIKTVKNLIDAVKR